VAPSAARLSVAPGKVTRRAAWPVDGQTASVRQHPATVTGVCVGASEKMRVYFSSSLIPPRKGAV
jgi:hypothetical protein